MKFIDSSGFICKCTLEHTRYAFTISHSNYTIVTIGVFYEFLIRLVIELKRLHRFGYRKFGQQFGHKRKPPSAIIVGQNSVVLVAITILVISE